MGMPVFHKRPAWNAAVLQQMLVQANNCWAHPCAQKRTIALLSDLMFASVHILKEPIKVCRCNTQTDM
jgi:hypothetical protein